MNQFDIPILYINLDRRTDRKEHMENNILKGYNYERISAVEYAPGYVGCTLSHIKCLERMIERDLDYCVILEDDFQWINDNSFENLKIPDFEYDLFLFCNDIKISEPYNEDYLRIKSALWTSGHIVSKRIVHQLLDNFREGYEKLIENLHVENYRYRCDIYMNKLFNERIVISLNNMVATQLDDYSDICKKYIVHSKRNRKQVHTIKPRLNMRFRRR